ncbi:MAG: P-loop NTPase [Acidimicrobiia bacterium]|nr:P-loop NTPase [Acidimicrobiia bacterium]
MSEIQVAAANDEFRTRLQQAGTDELGGSVKTWSGPADYGQLDTIVAEVAAGGTEVVLLGPGLDPDWAGAVAEHFDRAFPHISVVLVAPPTTATLERAIQAGARGVLDPAASPEEIRHTIDRALDAARRRASNGPGGTGSQRPRNRVMPVLAAKGGAGKTTVAVNLAVALGNRFPGEVVIVDLDLQFGDVATALGVEPTHTIADTLPLGAGLDSMSLKAFLTPKKSANLYALCAPDHPGQADEITPECIHRVLSLLARDFTYVVVDTAAGLDEIALETLDAATDLVILTSMDVPSVRATAKEIDALILLGSDRLPWHVVLNRATSKVGLSVDDIELTLGHAIDVRIPSSRSVPTALNHGAPVYETDSRSPVSRAFGNLADRTADIEASRSGFLRRRSN